MTKKKTQVLRLKITLEHIDPAPWREIEIRSDKFLPHLHDAIQAAFLWYDMHLWDFQISDRKYQMKSEDFWIEPMFGPPVMEVTTKKLDFFQSAKVPPVSYVYDFGDYWQHRVDLVSTREVVPNEPLPRFVGGQWATPPEDIGGPPMYEAFKEARKDVNHLEHEWAKEAGYVDWAHDEIHADVVSEQFATLQRQKTRRTSRWVMEG
ncbi:plasmid pRiA4b ORF-3 family protein [Halocynthiibacter namhaensis]|uniref:plasmid pRiA4b ORF-3 family protein n=1 Tax=Halocynthiibacter namhaensis TaxID=1290553 RepID=UPI0005795DD4|nr:plasmid pRiA4b ORF-3 family protein [Halocynthiibacter namhaensis]